MEYVYRFAYPNLQFRQTGNDTRLNAAVIFASQDLEESLITPVCGYF